jgi:hypothetical protein
MIQKQEDQMKMMSTALSQTLCVYGDVERAKVLAKLSFDWAHKVEQRDEIFREFGDAAGWTGTSSGLL